MASGITNGTYMMMMMATSHNLVTILQLIGHAALVKVYIFVTGHPFYGQLT